MQRFEKEQVIEIKKLYKYYTSGSTIVKALDGISLSFSLGEFAIISGESGCGKSTLLNIICGFLPYEEGEIWIEGNLCLGLSEEEYQNKRKENIGYISQNVELIESYTVYENLMAAIVSHHYDDMQERIEKVLEMVGLTQYKEHIGKNLSAGQRQRVTIARELLLDRDIIIADEPTANLDYENAIAIMDIFANIAKEKLVIMTCHDGDISAKYATRSVVINKGRVISDDRIEVPFLENISKKQGTIDNDEKNTSRKNFDAKTLRYFVKTNLLCRKSLTIFRIVLLYGLLLSFFVVMGQMIMYGDERIARKHNDTFFVTDEDNRLLVSQKEGEKLTVKDEKTIGNMSEVTDIEFFGVVTEMKYSSETNDLEGRVSSINENTKKLIAKGKIPKKIGEIVVAKGSGLKLGDKIQCDISSEYYWERKESFYYPFEVVGICDNSGEQIFFSRLFCDMLSKMLDNDFATVKYGWVSEKEEYAGAFSAVGVLDFASDKKNIIRISKDYEIPLSVETSTGRGTFSGDEVLELKDTNKPIKIDDSRLDNSDYFVFLSEDLFRKLHPDYGKEQTKEISIHITNYQKTDKVINNLEAAGYHAISTYRVSKTDFDEKLVNQRFLVLVICAGIIVLLCVIRIAFDLMYLFMERKKNQIIAEYLRDKKDIRGIKFVENLLVFVTSLIFVLISIVCIYLGIFDVDMLTREIRLFSVEMFLVYVGANMIITMLPVCIFYRKY